jgi:adenylate cyclase
LAATFGFIGKLDDCAREVEKALELDPLSVETAGGAGTQYLYARQYDKAIKHLKDAVELDPKNAFYLDNLGLAHIQKGMTEEGLEEVKRAAAMSSSPSFMDLAYAYVKAGKPEEARGILTNLLQSPEGGTANSMWIAGVYAALDEKEKALVWLERAYQEHSGYLVAIRADFIFDGLRDDPRFHALLKKMNLD